MFGIGFSELSLIFLMALIIIGPKKLPEIAKALGRGYSEFQKAIREVKDSLEHD